MKNAICVVTSLLGLSFLSACSTSQKETATQKTQVVEFAESEVPYMQVTKKDGKLSAEIVDLNASKVTVK